MSRRAKIVCTLGPATASPDKIARLVAAGLDVARLNPSHGSHADHQLACERVRAAAGAAGRSVGILADLQGPKIRLGTFPGGPVRLNSGDEFTVTTEDVPGDRQQAPTTYQGLAADVRPARQPGQDELPAGAPYRRRPRPRLTVSRPGPGASPRASAARPGAPPLRRLPPRRRSAVSSPTGRNWR